MSNIWGSAPWSPVPQPFNDQNDIVICILTLGSVTSEHASETADAAW